MSFIKGYFLAFLGLSVALTLAGSFVTMSLWFPWDHVVARVCLVILSFMGLVRPLVDAAQKHIDE